MVDIEWTAREITALRDALRLSKPEFARRVGVRPRTLRLWESEQIRDIRAANQRLLYETLNDAPPDAQARFERYLEQAAPLPAVQDNSDREHDGGLDAWEVDDVKRRELGRLGVGAIALMAVGGTRISIPDVQRLRDGADWLEQEDQRCGGAGLVDEAVRELGRAKTLLETALYDSATADAFASATGELAVMAGWLAFDADRQPLARRCYADALALGTEADNDALIARTCLYAANQTIRLSRVHEANPHRAIQLIGRARDLMRGSHSGRMHVLIAIRDAQVQAVLRDQRAFDRAITTAWREMDYAATYEPVEECPRWLRFVTHAEVGYHEARGRAAFEEFDRAILLLDKAVSEQVHERNASLARASSARFRLQSGDVTGAVVETRSVLTVLQTLNSTRVLRELRPVREAVGNRPSEVQLCDDFDRLDQKATA